MTQSNKAISGYGDSKPECNQCQDTGEYQDLCYLCNGSGEGGMTYCKVCRGTGEILYKCTCRKEEL